MDIATFIKNFEEAFSRKVELPLVFWYSNTPYGLDEKVNGCLFKCLSKPREEGTTISLSETENGDNPQSSPIIGFSSAHVNVNENNSTFTVNNFY